MNPQQWLIWSGRLHAIAQNGLAYAENSYDRERYEQIAAIAEEIMAGHCDLDAGAVQGIFAGETGYATPKVDVRGFVRRGSEVLLVRERSDGLWSLPGGWADVNDAPSEAVEREIREESGFRAEAVRLLALYDRNRHGHPPFPLHVYKLFFECRLAGGEPAPGMETEAVAFFEAGDLPPLSATRVTVSEIARLFELTEVADLPTDFD